ncbi:MAG TPA: hypothetical protein PKH77_26410 [Anaerolineae bacterium]|nr:hypothetical protein [Anaerolineae bacterium]
MQPRYHWLLGLSLSLILWVGALPVAAQKGTPPPTPPAHTPAIKPTREPPPSPPPEPEKPTAPPTPTPEPPTPVPPTDTPEPTPPPVVLDTATPTPRPPDTATPIPPTAPPLKATPEPLLALPTATATLPVPEVITATTVVIRPHPGQVGVQQVQERRAALPVWVQVVSLLIAALLLAGGVGLAWRFVHYTRQDLVMKRRQLAAEESARVAAQRREVEARLASDAQAWRPILAQIITDALGTAVRLVPNVDAELHTDPPQFSVTDAVTQTGYHFTPTTPPKKPTPGTQVYPLIDPQVRAEVLAVWNHLVQQQLNGVAPAIPRQAPWTLHYLPAAPAALLPVR